MKLIDYIHRLLHITSPSNAVGSFGESFGDGFTEGIRNAVKEDNK